MKLAAETFTLDFTMPLLLLKRATGIKLCQITGARTQGPEYRV